MMLAELDRLATTLDPSLVLDDMGLRADDWQRDLLRADHERTLVLSARQVGKSSATAGLAVWSLIHRPGSLTLIISPSLRQSSETFRKVVDGYKSLGCPVPSVESSATTLALATVSRVVSLPCSEQTVRGFSGVNLLIIDEAARVPDDLYFALLPMLATSLGRLVALSTPFGMRGWYHEAWHDTSADWRRVRVPASMCPRISPRFLAEQRILLGARWYAKEFECAFTESTGQVFSSESIMAAFDCVEPPLFGPASAAAVSALDADERPLFSWGA